ncbi:MAG: hypothetical protein JWS12_817 [Candidatus Saccharibacteria bacterium]|nr:hypothetical protein [Candidatus Saccharibacteria bacterium]
MSKISRKELAGAVLSLLDAGKSPAVVAQQIAEYLVAERRTTELTALMREVENLRFERSGVLEAEVSSAHELTPALQQEIKDLFQAKHTLLDYTQDAELIGGMRVRTIEQQLDISVEHKLNQLKHANEGA